MKSFRKSVAIFLFVLLLFLSLPGLASDQILLKNAKIYSMGEPGILAKGMILIENGKIGKIGPDIPAPPGAKTFDLSDKTIIPGLVCASSALYLEKKDLRFSGEERPDTHILEGIHYFDPSFAKFLEHGITTAYISPVSFRFTGGLGAVVKIDSGESGKISILKEKAALNIRLERLQDKKTSNVLRLTQYHRIRDQFKQAEEYRKEWAEYKERREKYEDEKKQEKKPPAAKKPEEPKKPKRDESKEILVQAMDKKIPVRFIVHRPDSILQALRLGEEFGLRIILEQSEEWPHLLGELEKASVALLSNPLLDYRRFLIPGRGKGYAAGFLQVEEGDLFYPYRAGDRDTQEAWDAWDKLAGSGIPFALVPPDHFPLSARFMRLYASLLLSRGASVEFALGAVTVNAAKILGIADRVGSLEEGKDADIVVLDGEPLDSLSKIELVFRNGTVVWERKR